MFLNLEGGSAGRSPCRPLAADEIQRFFHRLGIFFADLCFARNRGIQVIRVVPLKRKREG
ncbi:hypothetical protein GS8_2669 [Geobacillus stearothermophilus]|uniref:Uncharacterized protein n=1 Tax=Geobacillus stearothermophilus TaxID=1422 RepID=A0ABQ7HE98_GEOSE|nr:hypothetical protein GS8_2669 [Geobacillus stearothermophilus]